ncbi:MAG: hypothetical protein ACRDQ7_14515 [Haloechinothrix sp.]
MAVVEGITAEDVVRIYGGEPDKPVGECHFAQLYYLQGDERSGYKFHLQVGEEPYTGEPAPPWIKDVNVDVEKLRSTSLALMEQQTDLAFDRDWLTEVRPTCRIPDPYRMLADDDRDGPW